MIREARTLTAAEERTIYSNFQTFPPTTSPPSYVYMQQGQQLINDGDRGDFPSSQQNAGSASHAGKATTWHALMVSVETQNQACRWAIISEGKLNDKRQKGMALPHYCFPVAVKI